MYLLRQSYQIIPRASIWQGNLTYHMFLIVKWQKKSKPFCRVVGNTYVLLSTVLNWFSDCVVDQGFHVSHLWGCHRGDARVTRSSHRWELCTTIQNHTLRQRYGLSRSFQNLCHVSCIHFQGLRFYTELEIYIRFNCTKFISQFHLLTIFQAWFITNDSKFCLVFVLLHENLVDFLQIKYTSNLLCITTTYSENTEGESWL